MIRTRDYKYVLRLYEQDEFYDLSGGEEHNLIDEPEYKGIIEDLRGKLLQWLFETSDIVPFDKDHRLPDDFYLETIATRYSNPICLKMRTSRTLRRFSP